MSKNLLNYEGLEYFLSKLLTYIENQRTVKNVDTIASNGINLSNTNGTLDVTVTPGSVADGDTGLVTGDAVYDAINNASPFIVNITGTSSSMTADKSVSEIAEAVGDNRVVFAIHKLNSTDSVIYTILQILATPSIVIIYLQLTPHVSVDYGPRTEISILKDRGRVTVLKLLGYTVTSDTIDLAPLNSPSFTGTPTAPTPTAGDDSTKIATTAFVQDVADTKEDVSNKVTSLSSSSTDTLYPSAKAVYELVNGYDYSLDYLTFEALEDGTFNFLPFNNNEIYYSTDGKNWTKGNSVNVSVGDKVMWKGEMTPLEQDHSGGIGTFGSGEDANPSVTTISYKAYGNVMSLLYGDNFIGQTDLVGTWTFNCLFRKTKITESHNIIIPATTLTSHCYWKMFKQCTEMVSMPTLIATTLSDRCYAQMVAQCNSLTDNIPSVLPVMELSDECYSYMFNNCTSLVIAPKLPATTLTNNCYTAMFQGCSNLEVAPELPAPTLTSNCYWRMFDGCRKLNFIKCLATYKSVGGCCAVWMNNVAASGIFIKADGTTWGVGGSGTGPGVPSGWNIYSESEWEVVRHYELVTLSANGLMSSSDKTKLDGIAAGAQVNVVTSVNTTESTSGINLSLNNFGLLDVAISSGSIASGNSNFVTGGTVYNTTNLLAPKASPTFTGEPKAPTADLGTNNTQIATTAFVAQTVANALIGKAAFQGTVDSLSDIPNVYKKGYHWLVLTAGTYFTQVCEVGDIIYCVADSDATHEASWSIEKDFTVILNNLDIAIISNAEIDSLFTTESSNDSSNNG